MFRTAIGVAFTAIGLVFALLLIGGCGESHNPVVRQVRPEPANRIPPSDAMPMNPHARPHGGEAAVPKGPEVDVDDVRLIAPSDWVRKAPRVEFIRAEFTLPRAGGDPADGRLTVSVAGGGIKQNVDRWRHQFSAKPEEKPQEQLKVDGVEVTLVDFSGTYDDQMGGFGPVTERPNYRMLGAIFSRGGQLCFIKAYGPAKTMAARAPEFRAFVQSLKVNQPAK